ncbi:MAG: chemotaxis protein CheR [bacterium]|nr:chemotaxis protein CheR [bacterium]
MTLNRTTAAAPPLGMTELDDRTFAEYQRLMYERVGIVLNDNKKALVQSRVRKRLRALGLDCYVDYLRELDKDKSGREMVHLIDAISTNVTHFFREEDHFKFIKRIVDEWVAAGRRKLRFWSAACSTGEEPYSLAMTLLSQCDMAGVDVKILATDISTRVLGIADKGNYRAELLRTVPTPLRHRYFTKEDGGVSYTVGKELRDLVKFHRLNLIKRPLPVQAQFDFILCRNVMIYFDRPTRHQLALEFHRLLAPDSYLVTGHAETLIGIRDEYEYVQPSVHRRLDKREKR